MIERISSKKASSLLDLRFEDRYSIESWKYYCLDRKAKKRLAIDNESNDFFIEEFDTKEKAIDWLEWGEFSEFDYYRQQSEKEQGREYLKEIL